MTNLKFPRGLFRKVYPQPPPVWIFSGIAHFCVFVKSTVLWSHQRHCYIIKLSKWNLIKYYCAVWEIFLTCFWLNNGDWKLVPDPFTILFKWQYSEIWPFLIVYIYHFNCPLFTFSKKMKHWNIGITGYWVIGAGY